MEKKEKMVKQIDCQYYGCVHLICNHCDFVCLSVRGHLAFLHHYANRYVHFIRSMIIIKVAEQLRLENDAKLHDYDGNTVLVLVGNVTRVNIGALNYARSIGDYVVAMHVSPDEDVEKKRNRSRI